MMNFGINNDEIEKISRRIHELQQVKKNNGDFTEEEQLEYQTLFQVKDILVKANQIDDPSKYIVVGTMRVRSKDAERLYELFDKVNVDLDITRPQYLGEFVPGTKIGLKMPREKRNDESFEDYEEYLFNYYANNDEMQLDLDVITYHPGTVVPMMRKPYPHEMYYATEDGYAYDDKYLGTKNSYYVALSRYYDSLLAIERKRMKEEALDNIEVSINSVESSPIKVVRSVKLPKNYIASEEVSQIKKDEEQSLESTRLKVVSTETLEKKSPGIDVDGLRRIVDEKMKKDGEAARLASRVLFDSASKERVKKVESANKELIERAASEARSLVATLKNRINSMEVPEEVVEEVPQKHEGRFNIFSSSPSASVSYADPDYELSADEEEMIQEITLDKIVEEEPIYFDEELDIGVDVNEDEEVVKSVPQTIYSSIPKEVILGNGIAQVAKSISPATDEVLTIEKPLEKYDAKYEERAAVFRGYIDLVRERKATQRKNDELRETRVKVINVEQVPIVEQTDSLDEGLMSSFEPFSPTRKV